MPEINDEIHALHALHLQTARRRRDGLPWAYLRREGLALDAIVAAGMASRGLKEVATPLGVVAVLKADPGHRECKVVTAWLPPEMRGGGA